MPRIKALHSSPTTRAMSKGSEPHTRKLNNPYWAFGYGHGVIVQRLVAPHRPGSHGWWKVDMHSVCRCAQRKDDRGAWTSYHTSEWALLVCYSKRFRFDAKVGTSRETVASWQIRNFYCLQLTGDIVSDVYQAMCRIVMSRSFMAHWKRFASNHCCSSYTAAWQSIYGSYHRAANHVLQAGLNSTLGILEREAAVVGTHASV